MPKDFLLQLGLEYSYLGSVSLNGTNAVGIESNTETHYNYSFKTQSQQALALAKLLYTVHSKYLPKNPIHPYLSLGLGAAFNNLYGFNTSTEETGSLNITPTFADHNSTSFAYSIGLGAETDLKPHLRGGVGYRFTGIGTSALGLGKVAINSYATPINFTLRSTQGYINQFVMHISYIV